MGGCRSGERLSPPNPLNSICHSNNRWGNYSYWPAFLACDYGVRSSHQVVHIQRLPQGLDFLPISDGFRLRHPDESNVEDALREAEADRHPEGAAAADSRDVEGGSPEGAAGSTSGDVGAEEEESDPFDDVPISVPFVASAQGIEGGQILVELLAGDPIPGKALGSSEDRGSNEDDPDLLDTVAPYDKLDASSRLIKKYAVWLFLYPLGVYCNCRIRSVSLSLFTPCSSL